jgi:hypothetical protein
MRTANPSSKIFKLYQGKVRPEALELAKQTLRELGFVDFNKKSPFDKALPWFLSTLNIAFLKTLEDEYQHIKPELLPDILASFTVLQERQRLFFPNSGARAGEKPRFLDQAARLLGEMDAYVRDLMSEDEIEADEEIPFMPQWILLDVMLRQFIQLDDIMPGLEAMRVVTDYFQQKLGEAMENCIRFHGAQSAMGEAYKNRSLDAEEQNWAFLLDGRIVGMMTIEVDTGDGDYVKLKERHWKDESVRESARKEASLAVLEEVAVERDVRRVLVAG